MLLGTILLWALNVIVTRYVLTYGFRPLAYGTTRYFAATSLFWCFTWQRERSFRIQPFFVVLFALLLLSEHLNRWEIVGGVAIATGIALERWRRSVGPPVPMPAE